MNNSPVSRYELIAWFLFSGALLLLLVLKLLPALLAGLLVYALVNLVTPKQQTTTVDKSRLLAVTLIAAIVITLITFLGFGLVSFLRGGGENIPGLIQRMAEIIEGSRARFPVWLLQYLPADADALSAALVNWLRGQTDSFQVAGAELGRGLMLILIGMAIGALLSLERAIHRREHTPLSAAFIERALRLESAFRRVIFAQAWISAINTTFTALYLVVVLPGFGVELPFTKTLILITFVAGLLPILGNLISNTIIFIVSLSQSLSLALVSLTYLVIIHKLEYFLNARIIGGHIRARAWELLIAMIALEAAFGISGLIAAPIYYAYLKDELRAKELI